MSNDVKWIISNSGRYMFVRFDAFADDLSSTGFLAKIHYGNEILNQKLVYKEAIKLQSLFILINAHM